MDFLEFKCITGSF